MSEQEQIPEPQNSRPAEDDEDEQNQASRYYYTPAGKGGKVGPKDVPPASYDEPMIEGQPLPDYQGGYAARNNAAYTYQRPGAYQAGRQGQQQARLEPDGDAFHSRYQPNSANNQQWNVPPWARPQRNHWSAGQIAVLIILALLVGIPLLLSLAGIVIWAIFGALGLVFGAFLIFGIPFLIIRASIRRSLRRSSWRRRPWIDYQPSRWGPFWMGYRPRRRGPRWW